MKILLASKSPRRRELLQGLCIPFEVMSLPDVDESYPSSLCASQVAEYIARKKAAVYCDYCKQHDFSEYLDNKSGKVSHDTIPFLGTEGRCADREGLILLTADTVVVCDGDVLGKPHDEQDAFDMLRKLSGKTHQVYTGYCLTPLGIMEPKVCGGNVCTDVTFKKLSDDEISHYIKTYKPFDKAGAYGIQEWIGYIGITGIHGSYYNVMGLPVQRIYEDIRKMQNS